MVGVINKIGYANIPTKTDKSSCGAVNFANSLNNAASQNKVYRIFPKTDDVLFSGGNGSGLSYYLKYDNASTEEDPIILAEGIDENGKEFSKTIHVNDVNPSNASIVEMRALAAHLGIKDQLTELPPNRMGLNDKKDFLELFDKLIDDMNTLNQKKMADRYKNIMDLFLDFMNHKGRY